MDLAIIDIIYATVDMSMMMMMMMMMHSCSRRACEKCFSHIWPYEQLLIFQFDMHHPV